MSLDRDKMKQQDADVNARRLIESFTVQKWNEHIKSESKKQAHITYEAKTASKTFCSFCTLMTLSHCIKSVLLH